MSRTLTIALLASAAFAQPPTPAAGDLHPAGNAAAVAPSDAVLTIHGVCSFLQNPLAAGGEDCTVVVRRQEFDGLLKIVSPGAQVSPTIKHSLAKTYTDLLAFQIAAQQSGIDKSDQFQQTLEWLRLRTLADLYRRRLEKESSVVSEQEIADYYQGHISEFEEVQLRRMLVPLNSVAVAGKQPAEKQMLEIATEFRDRAANGENLDQLQKEAYLAVGLTTLPPATEVGTRRRAGLTAAVGADVFALKAGEVSGIE